jgi:hypothetical protein
MRKAMIPDYAVLGHDPQNLKPLPSRPGFARARTHACVVSAVIIFAV